MNIRRILFERTTGEKYCPADEEQNSRQRSTDKNSFETWVAVGTIHRPLTEVRGHGETVILPDLDYAVNRPRGAFQFGQQ